MAPDTMRNLGFQEKADDDGSAATGEKSTETAKK